MLNFVRIRSLLIDKKMVKKIMGFWANYELIVTQCYSEEQVRVALAISC